MHSFRPGVDSVAGPNNEFALAMFGLLRRDPGNLFFSPFSVRTALCMAFAGARGQTAELMAEALRISPSGGADLRALGDLIRRLNAGGGKEYELTAANSLWGQTGARLESHFLNLATRVLAGGANYLDFRRHAEAGRKTINRWVEDRTRERIRDLIPSGGVGSDTRLVLVNAVYFKGKWVASFPEKDTRDDLFHLEGGGTVRAPLMHLVADVRYEEGAGYQAVDLAYRGGGLSMLVILPDREDGLRELEDSVSVRLIEDCLSRMRAREVRIFLPPFKLTWGTADLTSQLAALGMGPSFEPQADFSGINGLLPPHEDALFLSHVFHKAFVEVNEEGTEAAAATALEATRSMRLVPPPVPTFRADHPFLFAIRDRASGAILLLGRLADPTRYN